MSNLYYVSSSPHMKKQHSVSSVMRDVIIALMPALLGAAIFFTLRAVVIVAVSVMSSVAFEALYNIVMKKKQTIKDLSAVVTGILIGFNMPVSVPIWLPVIASAFAIIVVKMLYGGIGKNIANPALTGRIFVFLSFSSLMTVWVAPNTAFSAVSTKLPLFGNVGADVVTTATPLSYLDPEKTTELAKNVNINDMFIGTVGGCLGETSAILLIVGGLYLLYKRVITWHIPVSFIGTVALITFLFPNTDVLTRTECMAYHLFGGGLMLGAIFMATDYATSPVTPKGRVIFGVGCGLLTVFIRYFGVNAEGVSFAILIMNFFVWFIDKHTIPTKFGGERKYAKFFKKFKK